jgi:hypothetical protein
MIKTSAANYRPSRMSCVLSLGNEAWHVFLIHPKGGGASCFGATPEEAQAAAEKKKARNPSNWVGQTTPYRIFSNGKMFCTTFPPEVREALGPELLGLACQAE